MLEYAQKNLLSLRKVVEISIKFIRNWKSLSKEKIRFYRKEPGQIPLQKLKFCILFQLKKWLQGKFLCEAKRLGCLQESSGAVSADGINCKLLILCATARLDARRGEPIGFSRVASFMYLISCDAALQRRGHRQFRSLLVGRCTLAITQIRARPSFRQTR